MILAKRPDIERFLGSPDKTIRAALATIAASYLLMTNVGVQSSRIGAISASR